MIGIFLLTIRRSKEPAAILLFVIGCVFAFAVHALGRFEILSVTSKTNRVLGDNNILFGTVVLCGMSVLIAVFNAASEIPRDISSRMISVLLSKPVSRHEYVLGKYLSSLAMGLVGGAIWLTIMLLLRKVLAGKDDFSFAMVCSQYTCLLILMPITAIAICSSCVFSDIMSMIVTTSYILLSFAMSLAPVIASLSDPFFSKIILLAYFLFPNLGFFMQSYSNFWGNLALLLYAVSVSAIFLMIGMIRFKNSDLYARS